MTPPFACGPHPVQRDFTVAYFLDFPWLDIVASGGPKAKLGDLRCAGEAILSPWKVIANLGVYYLVARPGLEYVTETKAVPASPHAVFVVEVTEGMMLTDCFWKRPWLIYPELTPEQATDRYLQSLGQEVQHAA